MESDVSIIGILPLLVSGYLFNLIFYPFRFFTGRADGQRLFFMSAGSGLVLGAMAFYAAHWLSVILATNSLGLMQSAQTALRKAIPIPHAGSLLLTLFLGPLLGLLGNGIVFLIKLFRAPNIRAGRWVYGKMNSWFGSPLAQLLRRAADEQKLVLLNLRSRKVYCGRVMEAPSIVDDEHSYIELLPKFSIYRDRETLKFSGSPTNYPAFSLWESMKYRDELIEMRNTINSRPNLLGLPQDQRDQLLAFIAKEVDDINGTIGTINISTNFDIRDWIKVFPCGEIESASFFDNDAFDSWFGGMPNQETAETG